MANFFVYLAVIVCGASVLAIELLGTRIIAPFYGASLYLWSALISITLAALSLGYWIGGRWADRGTSLTRFGLIIGIAGVWIALVPWLRSPVFAIANVMEMRLAVLFCATILFFPPLALLGMVSPYAIRMKASSLDVVGRTAGNLYAISTVASVFAALLTGFVLIPNVGVVKLAVLIGVALIATSFIGFTLHRRLSGAVSAGLVLAIVGATGFISVPVAAAPTDDKIQTIVQSAYAELRVVDSEGTRLMIIDGTWHTAIDLSTWESEFRYVSVLGLAKEFVGPSDMLLIGLGGGAVVKDFVRDGWNVDAVEIDPVVTQLAREYFNLADSEATVYTMDGRQFLKTHPKTYNVIVMDAFGSSAIPFHLVTEEAFGLLHSRLAANGVLVMNIQCIGWHAPIVNALAATAGRQFKHVIALPIAEPPDQLGNLVLMMSDFEPKLLRDLPVPTDRFSPEYNQTHAWDNRFVPDISRAPVLTDDLNPVDIWSEEVNLALRKQIHATPENRNVIW